MDLPLQRVLLLSQHLERWSKGRLVQTVSKNRFAAPAQRQFLDVCLRVGASVLSHVLLPRLRPRAPKHSAPHAGFACDARCARTRAQHFPAAGASYLSRAALIYCSYRRMHLKSIQNSFYYFYRRMHLNFLQNSFYYFYCRTHLNSIQNSFFYFYCRTHLNSIQDSFYCSHCLHAPYTAQHLPHFAYV